MLYAENAAALEPQRLVAGFMQLLSMLQRPAALQDEDREGRRGRGYTAPVGAQEREQSLDLPVDSFHDYDEESLSDGRILRQYSNGSVRVENPVSGVIQEERADGSLVVSLPSGKDLFQQFRGEPLLVYDTQRGGPPRLASVARTRLPGLEEPRLVYHFEDSDGRHLVDVESLRYYQVGGGR